MDQIFISYSSKNRLFAKKIFDDLLSARYWVWMDPKLKPAELWEPQINDNLRKSRFFIVLISPDSIISDWVKHEGSMAFAYDQKIIPVKIAEYQGNLPIWVGKIQLHKLFEGSPDYDDNFQILKQLLGTPLPIRQYLDESIIHYQNSGILLEQVALTLILRHYDELHLPKDKKIIADKLIRESAAKLQSYGARYDTLKNAYEQLQTDHQQLQNEHQKAREKADKMKNDTMFRDVMFILLWIIAVLFVLSMISYLI